MSELPIVCPLSPDALSARRQGLLSELLQQSAARELLPDGLRLRFAPSGETLSKISAAMDAERRCCRFLRFTLTVEPDEGQFIRHLHRGVPHLVYGQQRVVGNRLSLRLSLKSGDCPCHARKRPASVAHAVARGYWRTL